MSESFVSLMYHNLYRRGSEDGRCESAHLSPSITRYFVEESAFREQLRMLCQRFDVMNFDDLVAFYGSSAPPSPDFAGVHPPGGRQHSRPPVQITFDDGWRGCVALGGPILEQSGAQAMLFVTTDLIGKPHFLSRTELHNLPRAQFQIGSHAKTHGFLCELSEDSIREELRASKEVLEQITGGPIDAVSIPNGAVDARVRRIAREVGYRFVFTSHVQRNTRIRGPLQIARVAVRDGMTAENLVRFAAGGFARQRLRQHVLSLPKWLLGPARYRHLRAALLAEHDSDRDMADLIGETFSHESQETAGRRQTVRC